MRIALTGASSTGKTFLATHLMRLADFTQRIGRFITADARALLDNMGFHSTDHMTSDELRQFQIQYYLQKSRLEYKQDHYITDYSFVDVAAFWTQRDTYDQPLCAQEVLLRRCQRKALRYHVHFYLPFGLMPFESDGYRSDHLQLHQNIDHEIKRLLNNWNLPYITLDTLDIRTRIEIVMHEIRNG